MRTMKHWVLAVAAASALALAGCGGGGSGASSMMEEPAPTPAEQIAELQGQINALRAELGLPAIDIADLTGSVSTLQGQVSTLQGQIAARDQQIADRDKEIADAARAAMTAQGKAVFGVLDPLGVSGTPADASIAGTTPEVSARYGGTTRLTGANLKTFLDGTGVADSLNDVEAATNPTFTSAQAGTPASLAAVHGFSGTMLTWEDTTNADTMFVYTDIGSPSSKLFSEVHGGGGQELVMGTDARSGVAGPAFDGRDGGTVTHEQNAKSAQTVTENDVVVLPGTFSGAAGSYQCAGATCTSSVNANGTITFGGGTDGWTFTANTGAMVSIADSAYMTFGWWMRDVKTSSDPLDAVTVFHGARGGTDVGDVDALTGTADYEGGAAGKYAWRDRVADTAHGGHFTAKAALSANFDTNMMSGSISDFRIGDDNTDPNWTVALREHAITTSDGSVARTGSSTQWAVGSSKANVAGGWQAQLSNTGASRNDNLPRGVSGTFNADFNEQGRMLGAFGANITNVLASHRMHSEDSFTKHVRGGRYSPVMTRSRGHPGKNEGRRIGPSGLQGCGFALALLLPPTQRSSSSSSNKSQAKTRRSRGGNIGRCRSFVKRWAGGAADFSATAGFSVTRWKHEGFTTTA